LTELIKGKYGLSAKRALEVGDRLSLSDLQCEHFADLFAMEFARSENLRKKARLSVHRRMSQVTQEIQNDAFKAISEWHHLALLELTEMEDHSFETADILAARLGLSNDDVVESLRRLQRLELIKEKDHRLMPTGDWTSVGDGRASEAVRKFHKQILVR